MIDRRTFNRTLGSAAAIAASGTAGATPAFAQTAGNGSSAALWKEYVAIVTEAQSLGLATPRFSVGVTRLDASATLPALTDLLDNLEQSAKADGRTDARSQAVIERAAELLRRATTLESAPSEGRLPPTARSLSPSARPSASSLKAEYEQLFRTCEIRKEQASTVGWYIAKLTDPEARSRYEAVAQAVCAPWFFIGIIHGMEASFNFRGHLHNGDSLTKRTVNVPANRPKVWNPPTSWEASAVDAIEYDHFNDIEDWSLASMLYRWEAYNGFRSRLEHNIHTPYLWSFSNHYTKGKFIRDNVWSGSAVSRQCGAAVMLKALVEKGLVTNVDV